MKLLFVPASLDDLIRLLKAWRFWVLGAVVGALLGAALYVIAPPPYRARATVLVDFNLEQAWPQDTDRQQFYYLEREARKLEEIAWSDAVMRAVGDEQMSIGALREHIFHLGQPAEGGWHFYADSRDPERARLLASAWARAFADTARENIASSQGLNSFIEITVTQSADLPTARSLPVSAYLLAGALLACFLASFWFLFFDFDRPRVQQPPSKRNSTSKANQQKLRSTK